MGWLDGIGNAFGSVWQATVGQAVKAVSNLFAPPPTPTMAQDSSQLSRAATDWEASARIMGNNGGNVVGNNGANILGNNGGNVVGNNGANILGNNGGNVVGNNGANILGNNGGNILGNNGAGFRMEVFKEGERNSGPDNPAGGVWDSQIGSHDAVILGDKGVKISVDDGTITQTPDGRTIVSDGTKSGPNGETIFTGETRDITDILKGKTN